MAELNLKQITDKLNSEFLGDNRKLVFWYDTNAEFITDIDTIELENAKVYRLEQNNQFRTKYFLEREDTTTNYLIYAPFPKPPLRENHLADTIRYSTEFFADRTSLLVLDLGIEEIYKPVIQRYIKFFASKARTKKFYELEIERFDETTIQIALMSVICKTKIVSFEEIIRTIIIDEEFENSKYLLEFKKYNLLDVFWKMCEETFGYTDVRPSVNKLIYTFFVTYTTKVIGEELPQSLKNYCSYKSGNIIAFIDSLMNSSIYKDSFNRLSSMVYSTLNFDSVLEKLNESSITGLEIFSKVDIFIIKWLISRLEHEDISANLNGYSIIEICQMRRKMHYGLVYSSHYYIIENAYYLIKTAHFEPKKEARDIWKSYISSDYIIDQKYRYFYYHYDKLVNNTPYETLRTLVENIYTNRYLNPLSVAWSHAFSECKANTGLLKQQDFYKTYVRNVKERTVVIISDALRFEVGQTLINQLHSDEKCTSTIHAMQSVLPSYTIFGMSALLPHKELMMDSDFKVFTDGKICDDLKMREKVLQLYNKNSRVAQFDDIKTVKDAKELTTGQDVVYIYHNQIDARGDKLNTEDEVFNACEEAIEEIHTMIKRLTSANNTRFIITADHGFIYKRDKLSESDKITGFDKANTVIGRRYILSNECINTSGVEMITLGDVLRNKDKRIITTPIGSDVFKVAGGGQNFVHGGASPQEIIIPVIEVKTNKSHTETKTVSIGLVSLVKKITNLSTNLDFIQSDPVTDVNKETIYKLFFITDDNEKISNENTYVADNKDSDASKRVFRLRFTFKNKQYDRNRKYYLVAYDEKNELEVIRHEVQMDLAFVDDFGFNI